MTPIQLPEVTLLLVEPLFAEPMLFLMIWLLLGWLLLRSGRHAPGTDDDDAAVVNHHQHRRRADPQRVRTLKLVLLGVGIYLLLRNWRNR